MPDSLLATLSGLGAGDVRRDQDVLAAAESMASSSQGSER
jgi:hypothetical protein